MDVSGHGRTLTPHAPRAHSMPQTVYAERETMISRGDLFSASLDTVSYTHLVARALHAQIAVFLHFSAAAQAFAHGKRSFPKKPPGDVYKRQANG